ncbi:LD-carboxypeptidase [Galbibacter sp. EGI 63066]|uniref:S66 peptidase family protein n=1 Tax=Galbibacter sp. EGI 63066 TaxID=2993559 RepID=UPI00224885E2|nr:LD-carboxypeptidase [Galbibacter sp. EGI 63066]MCX2680231.1 LD-carboxypeptidase [Galbibacter sp. EGI 63066]
MNRRKFIGRGIQASAISILPASAMGFSPSTLKNHQIKNNEDDIILPKQLKKGDTVGLIAPGYELSQTALNKAIERVEKMGFKSYHTSRILENHGYLSNTDEERIADVHHMFLNPDIDGIICARGGYGCTRILSGLNYDYIQQNPKVLVGFSDITAFLNAIYQRTKLITFHGPVGTTLNNDFNRQHLEQIITNANNSIEIKSKFYPAQTLDSTFHQYVINPGIATGRLVGGNLSLLSAMTGTPFEVDYTDKIVFIEEIDEDPYRIDRMLTQLLDSKTFKNAKGIVLGVFKGCDEPKRSVTFSLKEVIMDRIKPLNIPSLYGYSIGHIKYNITLPVGINATLNTASFSIKLLENSVSSV